MITGLRLPTPISVSKEALQDQRSAIFATLQGKPVIVVYCKRNRAGAMWLRVDEKGDAGVWTSLSPVSIDEYLEALRAQEVTFAQDKDLVRWVGHVTNQSGRAN